MGNKSSLELQKNTIDEITQETNFDKRQVIRLYRRFVELDTDDKGFLVREDLLDIAELKKNPLAARIVEAFFTVSGKHDHLNFPQFVRVLDNFTPAEKSKKDSIDGRHRKLKFAFAMYDLNNDGFITREEFKVILNSMVGANVTTDQLDNIAERSIEEADTDKDGKISFEEFCTAMDKIDIGEMMSIGFPR